MSETKKVNVPLLLLCGVFLVAVIVAITMAAQRNSLSAEVTELQQQIAEEQATWQAIAAEKDVYKRQAPGRGGLPAEGDPSAGWAGTV